MHKEPVSFCSPASPPSPTHFRRWLFLAFVFGALQAGSGQELASQALKDIEAIMAEKASRNQVQRKLDSQLWYAVREKRFGNAIGAARRLQSRAKASETGRVLVDITAPVTPNLVREISRTGGSILSAYPQHSAVRAELPLLALEAVAALPGVKSLRSADEYTTHAVGTVMEGVVAHKVTDARLAFNATGTGIKIGILSDSVDYLTDLQASGLLPAVNVIPGQAGSGIGEGTAMLQIVHSMAPGAELYFATAFGGVATFAENIRALRAAGCDVIVDDVMYFSESPFQDGPVAQAVTEVANSGALYFSAAGNSGSPLRNTGSTWEGDFKDVGPATYGRGGRLHDFGGTNANAVLAGPSLGRMDLFWADPLGAATSDYDIYILDTSGAVIAASTDVQNGTQDPWEKLPTVAAGQRVVIVKAAGKDRYLHLSAGRAYLKFSTPGATRGHNAADAPNAFGIAAARLPSPLAAFQQAPANPTESYSSDGPRRVFFTPAGTPYTPDNFSSTGGKVVMKPDMAAATGVTTAVPGFSPFPGTSAAAPHAAAVAALIWSHRPSLTAGEVADVLRATALDIDSPGTDSLSGAGVVMAYEALSYDLPKLVIQSMELKDTNGSGTLDPDECAELLVTLFNEPAPGRQTALRLEAISQSSVPGLRIDPAPRVLGDLPADGVTTVTATFRISTTEVYPCGTRIPLQLQLQCDNPYSTVLPFYLDPIAAGFGAPTRFTATGLPQQIPDPGTIDSTVEVADFSNAVAKVRVGMHIAHPYITDLKLVLRAPDGTESLLSINNGASGNDLGLDCDQVAIFSDEATRSIATAAPPYVGEFLPQQPLAAFVGKSGSAVNGTWTLKVQDQFTPDSGLLECWWLELFPNTCTSGPGQCLVPPSIVQAPEDLVLTNGNTAIFAAQVQGTEPLTYKWYFNTTNLLNTPNSPSLQLANVSSANEGLYTLVVSNPYGNATASADLTVIVRPIITCAPERTVALGSSWDLVPPTATGTNVTVDLLGTTTNLTACGPSHTVMFHWQATDEAGFTAACTQTVQFVDRDPPVVTCPPEKTFSLDEPWTFDYPSAFDFGDLEQSAYESRAGVSLESIESTTELGDEITLAGEGRVPVRFVVNYIGTNLLGESFAGSPTAQLKFYLNDGVEAADTIFEPGTALFDSGPRVLSQYGEGSLVFENLNSDASLPLTQPLPDRFTWTVQFSGLGSDDRVLLPVKEPATVGAASPWHWVKTETGWALSTNVTGGQFAAELHTRNFAVVIQEVSTVTNAGCEAGYQVTRTWDVQDECGNTVQCTQTVNVLDPQPPVITLDPADVEVVEGSEATFSVAGGPCGPFTYQWFKDEAILPGATGAALHLPEVSAADAGLYAAVASNPFGSITSAVAQLTVLLPARITGEPNDVDTTEGQAVEFSVAASGTAPLSYYWFFNSTNLIPEVTGSSLELAPVTADQVGTYSVLVSNAYGTASSRFAELRLLYPPVLASPLADIVATNGQNVTWEIFAGGSLPLNYQWHFNETNLLAEAITNTLILTNVSAENQGVYSVTISNVHGQTTSSAFLTVIEPPRITSGPDAQFVNAGETATFAVDARGTEPLSYQWYGPDDIPLLDQTNNTLVVPDVTAALGGSYTIVVTNLYGSYTASAELRILGPVVIVSGPDDLYLRSGETGRLVVRAQGSDPLSYYWFRDGSLLQGATEPELLFDPVSPSDQGVYRVLVSNPYASTMSDPAVLEVIAPAAILEQPVDVVVTNGMPAGFSALVEGESPLALQWFFNETNLISGETAASLQIPEAAPEHAGSYTLVVSNIYTVVTSTPAQLIVVLPLEIIEQPASLAVNKGEPAELWVEAAGSGPITYQWFRAPAEEIPGATADRLTFDPAQLSHAGSYYVVVSNPYGTGHSELAHLKVIAPPELTGPFSLTATNGDDVAFTVEATGTEPLVYQWYRGEMLLEHGTNSSLVFTNVSIEDEGAYAVVVANEYGTATNSANLTVIVELTLACVPERSVELGENWEFLGPEANGLNVVVTAVETVTNELCGATFTARRTWEATDSKGSSLQCAEIVQVVDTTPPVMDVVSSKVVTLGDEWDFDEPSGTDVGGIVVLSILSTVTNSTCAEGFESTRTWQASDPCENTVTITQTVTVEDQSAPVVASAPDDVEVLENEPVTLEVLVVACPPLAYQWYYNETNIIEHATNASLVFPATVEDQEGLYSVTVTNLYGGIHTAPTMLTVRVPAQIVGGPADIAVPSGQDAVFSVAVRGTAPVAAQWFLGENEMIPGATDTTLTLAQVTPEQSGVYSILVSNAWGQVRKSAFLNVLTAPQILSEPQDYSVAVGASVTFSVDASGNPAPQYQWYFQGTNVLAGATQSSFTIVNAQPDQAGEYSVLVSNPVDSIWSRVARLSLTDAPVIVAQPQSTSVYQGGTAQFSATAAGAPPLTYQWYFRATNLLAGANEPTLSIPNVEVSQRGDYTLVVSNLTGHVVSQPATLRVLVVPDIVSVTKTNSLVTITLTTETNLLYSVFAATNLTPGSTWTILPKGVRRLGTGLPIKVEDSQAVEPRKYYSVIVE